MIALSLAAACLLWWKEHLDAGRLGIALLCWLWGLQQGVGLLMKLHHWPGLKHFSSLDENESATRLSGVAYRYSYEVQQYCYPSGAATPALGLTQQSCQLSSTAFDAMVHPDDREALKRARCLALRQGYFEHIYRLIHGASEQKVLDRGIILHRDGVAECHGLLMDISQLEKAGTASPDDARALKAAAPERSQEDVGTGSGSAASEDVPHTASFCTFEALQQAMTDNQLRLAWQPQVHAHDHRLAGFEVLLRWQHPDHGDISPATFIPVAESTGLMPSLGSWVIEAACQQICCWRKQGYRVPMVAINVSVLQLDRTLLAHVSHVLTQYRLKGDCLEFEITESRLMQNLDECMHVISALRRQGIRISLDDFGTGYSSLDKLALLPLDRLKLDKSFVNALTSAGYGYHVIEAVVRLAHSLRLMVVAEGVETRAQLHLLNELGCEILQGYLFGAGVGADTAVRYLRQDQTFEKIIPAAPDACLKAAIDRPSMSGENDESRF
ncbi:hypothetical protein GCM10010082_22440 [Kushneria pakistanensis]|uniref:EAL domain-containing protein n=1 Tax=Kushneria pakistanensis TaxID=1508770 RepID=A0ABQ3FL83_9GAMM|nr:hypothetical protein GCM10010082_22440 [Kushneria pakistanensis]